MAPPRPAAEVGPIETQLLIVLAQASEAAAAATPSFGRAATAAFLALVATVALPIGAALGVYARPPQRLVAAVMAFGAGALIEALAIDLAFDGAQELIRQHLLHPVESWLYVAVGFVIGGLMFFLANRVLEGHGAALRKPALAAEYTTRYRHRWQHVLHALHADHLPHILNRGPRQLHAAEQEVLVAAAGEAHKDSAPMAIFLGALLDGIPESIVIGAEFTTLAAFNPSFLMAVFLNNLPEAMSSAAGMQRAGFSKARVFTLWTGLMVASAVFGAVGNVLFASAPPTVSVFVNAVAGGGILAMLAATMMPEAYEEGGAPVGLATIAGFLAAFFFTAGSLASR